MKLCMQVLVLSKCPPSFVLSFRENVEQTVPMIAIWKAFRYCFLHSCVLICYGRFRSFPSHAFQKCLKELLECFFLLILNETTCKKAIISMPIYSHKWNKFQIVFVGLVGCVKTEKIAILLIVPYSTAICPEYVHRILFWIRFE